jgi:hypothetical protein
LAAALHSGLLYARTGPWAGTFAFGASGIANSDMTKREWAYSLMCDSQKAGKAGEIESTAARTTLFLFLLLSLHSHNGFSTGRDSIKDSEDPSF